MKGASTVEGQPHQTSRWPLFQIKYRIVQILAPVLFARSVVHFRRAEYLNEVLDDPEIGSISRENNTVPTLHVLQGPDKGKTFSTGSTRALLGRASDDIPLSDSSISRRHAALVPENGHWMLLDLKSANGTYINGLRMEHPTMMKHGDQIRLGTTLMVFGGDQMSDGGRPFIREAVELDDHGNFVDSSVIESIPSNEDSLILAAPETAEAVRAWRIMYQLTEAIGAVSAPDELLKRVIDLLFEHMQVDRGVIMVIDDDGATLTPKAIRSRVQGNEDEIPVSRTIINHVMRRCEGVLCSNAMADQRFESELTMDKGDDSIHRYGLSSVICVPIMVHRRIHGIIQIDSAMASHTYSIEQLRLATAIGHMTGMAIENAKLVQARLQNERLAAAGETVAFLSHYIKNILQGMRSGADVVELGLKREALDTIQQGWSILDRGLEKIFTLTTNMLTFSKDREPDIELAQFNAIVQEAVDLAQRHADMKNVMLLTDLEDIPPVPVDTNGVHQVALNLVNNAIDACAEDSGRVIVRSHYEEEAEEVILTIEDNGAGIPQDKLAGIFDVFESTKGQGGTGLGLAAARKIIDEHNGRLTVSSRPGEGTTFRAHFPTNVKLGSDETHAGSPPTTS